MSTFSSLLLLVMSASEWEASALADTPSFHYQHPLTGQMLNCTKCPPGTHMAAYCTSTEATQCTPCPGEHFTELWNYLPRCLYCFNFCTGNMEVQRECTPVSNRVCRCRDGSFWDHDFCAPHSECGPGLGVHTKGTTTTDTVCEKCPEDHFSNSSSAMDACVKHKECGLQQLVLFHGSAYQDTLCAFCENHVNGSDMLRTFLDGFFRMHKMPFGKLKLFVTRHIHGSGEQMCTEDLCFPLKRSRLLNKVRQWLFEAPEEQLTKIPRMLRDSRMKSMARSLNIRLREIKEYSSDCSLRI